MIAAAAFVVFFFLHCQYTLTSWDYFIAAGSLYAASWLYSQLRIWLQHGIRLRAVATPASPDARLVRLAVRHPRASWSPGQHVFLRFPSMLGKGHALASHPFTICSLPTSGPDSEMVFYIRPRTGITAHLARLATSPAVGEAATPSLPVLLDGPYGGLKGRYYDGFDHTLVIAGGAGVGFTLALAHDFLRHRAPGARMTLVVADRHASLASWYADALRDVLSQDREQRSASCHCGPSGLAVRIHHTGVAPADAGSESSIDTTLSAPAVPPHDSSEEEPKPLVVEGHPGEKDAHVTVEGQGVQPDSMDVYHGRPDIAALGREVLQDASAGRGTVGIVVCGPASMVHDAGVVAADAQAACISGRGAGEVWFHKECFSS